MRMGNFFSRHKWLVQQNALLVAILLVTSGTSLLLAIKLFKTEPVVQLVPPHLTEKAIVAMDSADANYKMAWGMFFATLAGNVTPKNVKFVADSLSEYVDASIYPEVRRQLYALAADPVFSQNGGSVSFRPKGVMYDDASGKVFVRGELIASTVASKPTSQEYVFEWGMQIRQRRPWVVEVQHYTGAERTAKWLNARKGARERAGKRDATEEVKPELWFDEDTRFGAQEAALAAPTEQDKSIRQ